MNRPTLGTLDTLDTLGTFFTEGVQIKQKAELHPLLDEFFQDWEIVEVEVKDTELIFSTTLLISSFCGIIRN